MITYKNITDNPNLLALTSMGPFAVFEHQKDLSNTPESAPLSWFAQEMNVRQRQLLCRIQRPGSVRVQAGSMQWVAGAVESETGLGEGSDAVKSFLKGAIKGAVTGEAAVKPVYSGDGILMLEPTYKHILLEDVSSWGPEGIVLDDGLFLAAEGSLAEHVVMRKNLSSIFGGHGLFSLCFKDRHSGLAPFSRWHKVARKRDPPGGLSTGRDALLRVRGGERPDHSANRAGQGKRLARRARPTIARGYWMGVATWPFGVSLTR